MNTKCKGCPDRTWDCHSKCKWYLSFENRNRKARERTDSKRKAILLRRIDRATGTRTEE